MTANVLEVATLATPIGPLDVCVRGDVLVGLGFGAGGATEAACRRFPGAQTRAASPRAPALAALRRYFDGDLAALDALAVDPGGTAFQAAVWRELRRVPAGRTASYSELARRAGHPRAVRAVGLANARNPIALVIPCHRVIGADGSLTGYGGGLDRKRWLLTHERALLDLAG